MDAATSTAGPDTLDAATQERADLYALLAALLLGVDDALLDALAQAQPAGAGHHPLQPAWQALASAAARCRPRMAAEHDALFVAAGTPLRNPYQCYYLAGCLMDKPLAALRADLQRLGLARSAQSRELEDHLGALCEAMRLLVLRGAEPASQRAFFERHLGAWTLACLADIRNAPGADFYRAVADFTEAALALEREALGLDPLAAEASPSGPLPYPGVVLP